MKNQILLFSLLLIIVININAQEKEFPKLTGPYLGFKPPRETPELFAPGVISVKENFEHSAAVFSPNGKEVFWCTNINFYTDQKIIGNLRLYYMKIVDGKWTAPQIAPFVKNIRVERPVFSPDGNKLYIEYGSDPTNNDSDSDIYVVERIDGAWSEPVSVSPLINTPAIERLHCVTGDGSLYFSRNPFTRNEEIFVSRWVNGKFTKPEKLGKNYNSADFEAAILIAPNEEYMLIWQNSGYHSRLTVSYKQADGTWSGRFEAPYYCGNGIALSPDGKYLFMENEGIRWVNTSFIEELKTQ
jgi:hypothetical protein